MILVGSTYFFKSYPDFVSKDTDWVEFVKPTAFAKTIYHLLCKDKCIFYVVKKSKEEIINDAIALKTPMQIGKFLVPEFCQEIQFTIEDLKKLLPLAESLDDKHKYEKIIFDSYIKNNDFILTEEQRAEAYDEYKKSRKP